MHAMMKFHRLTRDRRAYLPESFLRRWSRLKLQSAVPAAAKPPDTGLSALLNPEAPRDVRQAALRQFFMSDHYRVMDGLDVYVDDYSNLEPLPVAILGKLVHAAVLLGLDEPVQETAIPPQPVPEQVK